MTTEERLEALTHSCELLKASHEHTQKELRALSRELRAFMRMARILLFDHGSRLNEIDGGTEEGEGDAL